LFFFFTHKTAYEMRISDWSSDVCSSDLATQRQAVVRAQARLPFGRKRQPCAAEIAPDRIEQAHFVGNGADDPLIVANLGVDIRRGRTDREPLDHSGAQFQFGTLDTRLGDIDQAIPRIE